MEKKKKKKKPSMGGICVETSNESSWRGVWGTKEKVPALRSQISDLRPQISDVRPRTVHSLWRKRGQSRGSNGFGIQVPDVRSLGCGRKDSPSKRGQSRGSNGFGIQIPDIRSRRGLGAAEKTHLLLNEDSLA
jgi:hypothetical protein